MLYNLINFNSWAQFFAFWVYFTLFDITIFMLIANFYINGYLKKKGDVKDMVTDAQKRAAAKYDKSHTKGVYIKLNKTTDADILERLQEVGNVQGYIKELIRKDIC